VQTLSPDFCCVAIEQVVYYRDGCLHCSDNCMEKKRICPLFLVILNVCVVAINMSVTPLEVTNGTALVLHVIQVCHA
jgi:hypothetical protein